MTHRRLCVGSRYGRALVALATLCLMGSNAPVYADEVEPKWRFANSYTAEQLLISPEAAQRFTEQLFEQEAAFFAAARHPESGLTYDGWNLDPVTREPLEPRRFSAASKECLDLGLLIKALYGEPLLGKLVSPEAPEKAPQVAAEILARKVRSYQAYRGAYPGFAGYFTWFVSGEKAHPMKGWQKAIPTLDLGEMLWALLLAERALFETGYPEIARSYSKLNTALQQKAKEVMFHPDKVGVRGRVEISDPLSADALYSGEGLMTGEHGVHEGQMLLLYMSLYGGLTEKESAQVWDDVSMRRIEHPDGTTWQGFWGSPHEQWGYLFLPYRDLPEYRQLFRIREKIRTYNARRRGYPGFGASAHRPSGNGYMSAAGIEGVGSQPLEYQDTYTPYGAFPLLLEFSGQDVGNVGLLWLHNMLSGPGMQGPFGAAESGDNKGTSSPPIKTIDATFTTLLALSGGLEKEMADMLKAHGCYDRFVEILRREYIEGFSDRPLREPEDFALPVGPAGTTLLKDGERKIPTKDRSSIEVR